MGAGRPVVDEVDLATGAVRRHVIVSSAPASARAAKAEEGMNRFAQWMGAGRLAVTGYDAYLTHDDRQRMIPFGVQVMDTTTWRTRTLASRATWFVPAAPGYLLWPGRPQGGGMATYALATGRRTHRFGHASVGSMTWGGRYVYATVRGRHRTYVIDPASGRTVRVLKTGRTPHLLVD